MKYIGVILIVLLAAFAVAQTPQSFTVAFNLSQITLPGAGTSLLGAETDTMLPFTANNLIGMTTLTGTNYGLVGGRYDRNFPQVTKALGKLSTLNFANSEVGLTASMGILHTNATTHWGIRAGVYWRQKLSTAWTMNFEGQWCDFPDYNPTDLRQHNTYSIAIGPGIRF
jgi:hypothetical protein